MTDKQPITGVSAVNKDGVVVVFVEATMPDFDVFQLVDNEIRLISMSGQSVLARTYGPATIETISRSGVLIVQKLDANGNDAGNYVVEVVHGL